MPGDPESKLIAALDRALRELSTHSVNSEDYATSLDRVVKLHKMRQEEKSHRVKPETWVLAGTNLLGLLMVIHHERMNVITSKAFGLIQKPH